MQLPPMPLQHLFNLKGLVLSHCSMCTLPSLEHMTKLQTLHLDHNQLHSDAVGPLPESLKTISIISNQLIGLPSSFINLKQLTVLNLSNNTIIHLTGIEQLSSLIDLNLNNNQLQELPEGIAQLKNLKTLKLKKNKLHSISTTTNAQIITAVILLQSTSLVHLELAGNPLTLSELRTFEGIDAFVERRKLLKDKQFQGGITELDGNLCGLTD
jgi:leucine-rich repeat protein SHOC2